MKYIANPVEVDAEVIIAVGAIGSDGSVGLTLAGGRSVTANSGMLSRYLPVEGDYVVTQADGYVYVNPKQVFERKYYAKAKG